MTSFTQSGLIFQILIHLSCLIIDLSECIVSIYLYSFGLVVGISRLLRCSLIILVVIYPKVSRYASIIFELAYDPFLILLFCTVRHLFPSILTLIDLVVFGFQSSCYLLVVQPGVFLS